MDLGSEGQMGLENEEDESEGEEVEGDDASGDIA